MKKLLILLMTALFIFGLAACGDTPDPQVTPTTTQNDVPTETQPTTEAPTEGNVEVDPFGFTLNGVKLTVGQIFDPSALPEAEFVFEVPSCAIEGTDLVYNYGTVEITAYNDGTNSVIYSIYIVDPDTPTDEGLYMGDTLDTVKSLYGTDYTEDFGQLVFTRGNSQFVVILDGDCVSSMEFLMVTQ